MKSLILIFLLTLTLTSFAFAFISLGTEYGPTIPALPKGGELYHADVVDCNPEDYEVNDPHFFIILGYIWDDDVPMYAALFYRNDFVIESGLTNPSALFYGDDEEPVIFIRVATTVERFEGFEDMSDKYPRSICSIPREEI